MTAGFFNSLQFAVAGRGLEGIHGWLGVFHCKKQTANPGGNKFTAIASATNPGARIGKSWGETEATEGVSAFFMKSGARTPKSAKGFLGGKGVASQWAKLWAGLEANFLLGAGFQAGIADAAGHQLEAIEFSKEADDADAPE